MLVQYAAASHAERIARLKNELAIENAEELANKGVLRLKMQVSFSFLYFLL